MELDVALADAQAAKRMRVRVNQWGQLWPPITMVLGLDGLITVAGFAPHGEWKVTDDLELSLTFHCHGDPTKVKQSSFFKTKVPGADAWATVRCVPEWAAFLVPKTQLGAACRM